MKKTSRHVIHYRCSQIDGRTSQILDIISFPLWSAARQRCVSLPLMIPLTTPPCTPHPRPPNKCHHDAQPNAEQQQVVPDPEKEIVIPVYPRASAFLGEENPRFYPGPIIHHDSVQPVFWRRARGSLVIGLPNSSLKPLAASIADSDIRKEVVVVVRDKRIGKEDPEWMARDGGKNIVAEGSTTTVRGPHRIV